MELNKLQKIRGIDGKKKRVGRGVGSGKGGHTSGRGMKGQKARTGYNLPVGFEGGQVPLWKRIPQIGGFKNPRARRVFSISLSTINSIANSEEITPESLIKAGIIKKLDKRMKVKILGTGEIEKKVELKGFILSKSAKEKLEKAGAKIS